MYTYPNNNPTHSGIGKASIAKKRTIPNLVIFTVVIGGTRMFERISMSGNMADRKVKR